MLANFELSLFITLIGMGLVFLAILLLWGMMEIIVKLTAKKEEEEAAPLAEEKAGVGAEEGLRGRKVRAAAAAVAVALALGESAAGASSVPEAESAGGALTPWQAAGRLARINRRTQVSSRKGS